MLADQPNILAIIRRDDQGRFERIDTPIQLHLQPMITLVPNAQGVFVVLGLLEDQDRASLTHLLNQIEPRSSKLEYSESAFSFTR